MKKPYFTSLFLLISLLAGAQTTAEARIVTASQDTVRYTYSADGVKLSATADSFSYYYRGPFRYRINTSGGMDTLRIKSAIFCFCLLLSSCGIKQYSSVQVSLLKTKSSKTRNIDGIF